MALTVTAAGTANSTTSNASLAVTFSVSVAIGDLIVLCAAADNNGTSGVRSMAVTNLVDTKNNGYEIRVNQLNDPGAAAAGCHLGIWTAICHFPLTTSDTVTVTFSPNTTSKGLELWKITAAAGSQPVYRTGGAGTNTVAGTTATVTTASMAIGEAVIGAMAFEGNVAITADADATNGSWSAAQTALGNTGTDATSMAVTGQSKIVTGAATQTYNTSWTGNHDAAIGYIIALETPNPVGNVYPADLQVVSYSARHRASRW